MKFIRIAEIFFVTGLLINNQLSNLNEKQSFNVNLSSKFRSYKELKEDKRK